MKRIVNFRLSKRALHALRENVKARQRSEFIRRAIDSYLELPKQHLTDRPHIRGFEKEFEQVAAMIDDDCIEKIKNIYPNVSSSVVIETAIMQAINLVKDAN
jgi:metal-responsive CopG/Arc/MetJ family transcriptional regulator